MPVNLNKNERNVVTFKLITGSRSSCRRASFVEPAHPTLRPTPRKGGAILSPRIYLFRQLDLCSHTQQIAINKSNKRSAKHEQIYKFALKKAEEIKKKKNINKAHKLQLKVRNKQAKQRDRERGGGGEEVCKLIKSQTR